MKGLALLLLVLWKGTGSWSLPPIIDGKDELIFNAYEPFTLSCRGSKSLKWKSDHEYSHENEEGLNITYGKQNGTDRPFVSNFYVREPGPHDTGYYSCYYDDVAPLRNDTENVDSTYVYVQSEYSAFVNPHPEPVTLTTSETLVIECATTHPDIRPSLLKDKDKKKITGVQFDPRKGFEIKNVSKDNGGIYICEARHEEIVIPVTIDVLEKLPPPNIDKGKNQQFVKGDSFFLKCIIAEHQSIEFHWSYPNKEAKYIATSDYEMRKNTRYEKSTLEVPKASEADTGYYTCFINSTVAAPNSDSEYIRVEETMASFVNITSGEIFSENEGQNISWKSEVESYPAELRITYTDPSGQDLYNTTRITIYYDDTQAHSWLKIDNISYSDFGNYTITVTTADGAATNSTTALFEVRSAPYVTMDPPSHPFMEKGKKLNVTCLAQGFPRPDISLLFKNCSSGYTNCSSFSPIETKNKDDYPSPGNIVRNSFVFSPNASGFLLCNGSNDQGSKNQTTIIQISDERKPAFEKKINMNNQTETVKEYKRFSLKSFVTGNPKPAIQWMRVFCRWMGYC